jgi:hypothetical protein
VFKICPACGEEFRATVSRCSDCDVELVFPGAAVAAAAPAVEAEPLLLLKTDEPRALEQLAQHLSGHGISSRIDSYPPREPIGGAQAMRRDAAGDQAARLGIYVPAQHLETAYDLAQQLLRSHMPAPPGEAGEDKALLEACPACGTALEGRIDACGECGLEFAVVAVICTACGHEGTSEQAACTNCGHAFFAGVD